MEAKKIFKYAADKYPLSYFRFLNYYRGVNNINMADDEFSKQFLDVNLEISNPTHFKSYLYDFFEQNNIIICPFVFDIRKIDEFTTKKRWGISVWVNNTEIRESEFVDRDEAEWMAFSKAFLFLHTELQVQEVKKKYIDQSSDSSAIKIDYELLTKVIDSKRLSSSISLQY